MRSFGAVFISVAFISLSSCGRWVVSEKAPASSGVVDATAAIATMKSRVPTRASYNGLLKAELGASSPTRFHHSIHAQARVTAKPNPAINGARNLAFTPSEMQKAYNYPTSLLTSGQAGAGQTIAIVDPHVFPNCIEQDLRKFSADQGLPYSDAASNPTLRFDTSLLNSNLSSAYLNLYQGGAASCDEIAKTLNDPSAAKNPAYADILYDQSEIALDVQWAHAMAPDATILVVGALSATDLDLAYAINAALSHVEVNQVSLSYGSSESVAKKGSTKSPSSISLLESMLSQQTTAFFAAAGDDGEKDDLTGGKHVDYPASSTSVIGVGGTNLFNNPGGPRTELSWDDKPSEAGGGGFSTVFQKPLWQSDWVPTQLSKMRSVPDLSYNADVEYNPVTVYSTLGINSQERGYFAVGGTSAGAPQWAAIMAVINSRRVSLGGLPILGGAPGNPGALESLYGLASLAKKTLGSYSAETGGLFYDITQGLNGPNVYRPAPGFDQATGLGSPDISALVDYLGNPSCLGNDGSLQALGCMNSVPQVQAQTLVEITAGQPGTPFQDTSGNGNNGLCGGWCPTAAGIFTMNGMGTPAGIVSQFLVFPEIFKSVTPHSFDVYVQYAPSTLYDFSQITGAMNGWGAFNMHSMADGTFFAGTDEPSRFALPAGSIKAGVMNTIEFNFQADPNSSTGTATLYLNGQLAAQGQQSVPQAWGGFAINRFQGLVNQLRIRAGN